MAAAERDNSWKGRQHKTLQDWMRQPDLVAQIAEEQAHALRTDSREGVKPSKPDGLERPAGVVVPKPPASVIEIRAEEKKIEPESDHGKLLIFRPAQVKVVIVREEVGRAWDGTKIHEVVDGQGKRFLASEKQLQSV